MDTTSLNLINELSHSGESIHLPASSRVYDSLRKRLLSFELPPETTLSRARLAKEYNVSNTPIREAMLRLEQDGLIKTYPQSKTIVTKINIPKLNETHFLRTSVECEIVRQIAENQNVDLISKLRALIRMQKALSSDEAEITMFNELDDVFHQNLYITVNQIGLYHLIQSKSGHLARARRLDLPRSAKIKAIVNAHEKIVDAMEKGDGVLAQKEMRTHLAGTVARLDILKTENPNYFGLD